MSVLNFAQEFSHLINRYTRTSSPHNDATNAITPLTEEQIVSTIYNVLLVLINKDKNYLLSIFNNASVATIPETSVVQIKYEPNVEDIFIFRFQDVRSVTSEESSFCDISLKDIKKEQENPFNTLQNDKKFISRSNPAIYVNNISRSDTFVREVHLKETNDEDVFKDRTGDLTDTEIDLPSDLFYESLKEIRKSVMNIMTKLNHLEQSFSQLTKSPKEVTIKAQKSFLVNNSSNGISIKIGTSVDNRPSTASSKTPNSSKQHTTDNKSSFERRKSTGAIGNATPVRKSGESIKVCNSISSVDLSPYKPVRSSDYRPKFTKNPKYAHIQSTIPKAISQKKKQ
ncbi:uncharacterized protein [Mycetomoellerius zeteki]|uniref:uncharacterized protein n=1 Tax=Mycetomoellerius zeteki TaxID=64791 RepID=UPI00084E759F|nr:PREDICTED: uncharacterized protein LOC108725454 [Trachymyrmex zeteki]